MALTLKSKKAEKSATAIVVDRIVELKKQIDALAPAQKELDKLVADLREQAMDQDPDQVVTFEGSDYSVVFSEASNVRKIADMAEVKKVLGTETFMKVAKVTLGDLDKYADKDDVAKVCTTARGPRRFDVIEKA